MSRTPDPARLLAAIRRGLGRLERRFRLMRAIRELRRWRVQPGAFLTVETPRQLQTWIVSVLNTLRPDRAVFIDVGAARGDVLHSFARESGLVPPVFSIGIDPIDVRARHEYSAFVPTAISTGAEGSAPFFVQESSDCSSLKRIVPDRITYDPSQIDGVRYFAGDSIHRTLEVRVVPCCRLSTVIRDFALQDEVIHFLKIDAQGSDLDVFRSLDQFTAQCLFVQMETVYSQTPNDVDRCLYEGQTTFVEDRAVLEAAGFRLLGVYPFRVTPEADVLFVNMALFDRLVRPAAAGARAGQG